MGITSSLEGGVVEIVLDVPPVNALAIADWHAVASALRGVPADARVVVLRAADGARGFCAGVDIKELQRGPRHVALVEVNRACAEAFAAVYECAVPVIAAVHGFCLGGGVGLAGNADLMVA